MYVSTTTICTSGSLEPVTATEQRLEQKINDNTSFTLSINTLEEMITYFEKKNSTSLKIFLLR